MVRVLELSPLPSPGSDYVSDHPSSGEQQPGQLLVSTRSLCGSFSPDRGLASPDRGLTSPEARAGAVQSKRAFFEAFVHTSCDAKVKVHSQRGSKAGLCRLPSFDEPGDGEQYEELQLAIRVPRRQPREPSQHSAAAAEQIGDLQLQLAQKEAERLAASQALHRKSQEVENLTRIVRELTDSRAKLVSGRAIQSERLEDLTREYNRVCRLAELSRSLSKDNLARTADAQQQLSQAQEDVERQKQIGAYLREQYARAHVENMELRSRVAVLERLPKYEASQCLLEFTTVSLRETY